MIGPLDKDKLTEELNSKVEREIEEHTESLAINLFYSTKELTYERQIIPLKRCLDINNVKYKEFITDFEDHADVGRYFPAFVLKEINELL